mmetsp:Transcript_29941/g.84450  ORF Transcript_29941/g.84450 Transcript_29941/m.84450 type:complete len:214 (+) Transcript_29941:133-774(+)
MQSCMGPAASTTISQPTGGRGAATARAWAVAKARAVLARSWAVKVPIFFRAASATAPNSEGELCPISATAHRVLDRSWVLKALIFFRAASTVLARFWARKSTMQCSAASLSIRDISFRAIFSFASALALLARAWPGQKPTFLTSSPSRSVNAPFILCFNRASIRLPVPMSFPVRHWDKSLSAVDMLTSLKCRRVLPRELSAALGPQWRPEVGG